MRLVEKSKEILISARVGLIHRGLLSEKAAGKMAAHARSNAVLVALAERFPKSQEVHAAILNNPRTRSDYDLLALVERFFPEKISRFPAIAVLLGRARTSTDVNELVKLVKHPLQMVRLATCQNSKVTALAQTCNYEAVREAIVRNRSDWSDPKNRIFVGLVTKRVSEETRRPT